MVIEEYTMNASDKRRIDWLLWLGCLSPPLATATFMFAFSGGQYKPSALLVAMSISCVPPFLLLRYMVRADIAAKFGGSSTSPAVSLVPPLLTWLVMFGVYAAFMFAAEWSTYRHAQGSSTNGIAVIALPIAMLVVGMCSYGLASLVLLAISHLRRRN
jgi:hypothetical protein